MLNNFKKNYCNNKRIVIVEHKDEKLAIGTILKYKNKYFLISDCYKSKKNKNYYKIKETGAPDLYFDLLDIKNTKKSIIYCKSLFFYV